MNKGQMFDGESFEVKRKTTNVMLSILAGRNRSFAPYINPDPNSLNGYWYATIRLYFNYTRTMFGGNLTCRATLSLVGVYKETKKCHTCPQLIGTFAII